MNLGARKPEPTTHPVEVGLRSEAAILSELVRRGYHVLVPFGFNHRYDLVIDLDGEFVRAQCKTGRLRKGAIVFSPQSVRSNMVKVMTRDYVGDVDLLLVYCPETQGLFAVPIADLPPGGGASLRVDPTRNKQSVGIRWAHDYELPG
jgi:hypothetical protein